VLLRAAIAFFAGERELAQRYFEDCVRQGDPWLRAAMFMLRAAMAENEGDLARVRADLPVALEEFRRLGERWGLASTLRSIAQLRTYDGDLDAAQQAYEEAMLLMAEMKSREDEAFLLVQLADVATRRGDLAAARAHLDRARVSAEQAGSALESIIAAAMLAQMERRAGRPDRAREFQRQAAQRVELIPPTNPANPHARAIVLAVSAQQLCDDGDVPRATELCKQAHEMAVKTQDMPIVAVVGAVTARIVAETGNPHAAAEMLGAAACLRGSEDLTAPDLRELREKLAAELGADAFERAYRAGMALDRVEALARLDPVFEPQVRRP